MPTVCEMFKNLSYDSSSSDPCAVSKESVELFQMYESSDKDSVYEVDNSAGEFFEKLFTTVQHNLQTISELEELSGVAPRYLTLRHVNDALHIADYYRNFDYVHVGQKVLGLSANIFLGPKTSLFEFLLDLLAALQTCPSLTIHVHASRKPTALVICKEMVSLDKECNFEWKVCNRACFSTLFVTSDSDLESAADLLADNTGDDISLWKIRHVLVQESVLKRFTDLVSSRLRPFPEVLLRNDAFVTQFNDAWTVAQDMGLDCISNASIPTSVRPTLVLGGSRMHFDKEDCAMAPLITINAFRTLKEGIAAFNTSNGGSISIWAGGLSGAYEIAHSVQASTVWINCFAKFNQTVPFSFQPGGFNYGGDLGILDRFVKVRTSQVNGVQDTKPHKIDELCGPVICKLRAKYVNVAVDKNHHYECISSPLNLNDFQLFAEEEKVYSESLQMVFKPNVILQIGAEVGSNKMANTLFNRRKTTVFAFGETFAN